jgi:hypothetical protein
MSFRCGGVVMSIIFLKQIEFDLSFVLMHAIC